MGKGWVDSKLARFYGSRIGIIWKLAHQISYFGKSLQLHLAEEEEEEEAEACQQRDGVRVLRGLCVW